MKLRKLLALFVGVALSCGIFPAYADDDDDDDDDDASPAMQVMLDERTGAKLEAEDDSGAASGLAVTTGVIDRGTNANISAMIPATTEGPVYHADGSMSARIGLENLKYLSVVRTPDGEFVYLHIPAKEIPIEDLSNAAAAGEQ